MYRLMSSCTVRARLHWLFIVAVVVVLKITLQNPLFTGNDPNASRWPTGLFFCLLLIHRFEKPSIYKSLKLFYLKPVDMWAVSFSLIFLYLSERPDCYLLRNP